MVKPITRKTINIAIFLIWILPTIIMINMVEHSRKEVEKSATNMVPPIAAVAMIIFQNALFLAVSSLCAVPIK
jgi:hypothetical protein